MDIYKRYASGDHDREMFHKIDDPNNKEEIFLRPLSGHFDNFEESTNPPAKSAHSWVELFEDAAFFSGFDAQLFGIVVTMVYKNQQTNKISTVSMTKFGTCVYDNLLIDASSRFWPAVANLSPNHKDSNVRRALAITNLKNYNRLWNNNESFSTLWDETNAGSLASSMEPFKQKLPLELGCNLLHLGLLQNHLVSCCLVDVVYNSAFSEENNKFVHGLGSQIEQLFDPLSEYCPQQMDYSYIPPNHEKQEILQPQQSIVGELFAVQEKYALDLVNLLQNLILPLRVKALSLHSFSNAAILKVNLVFPHTIDEVTRVNCILHDSLKKCRDYGIPEVFKVFANLLPYLYRAFARHEANAHNFVDRLDQFLKTEDCPQLPQEYSIRSIEAIVCGCLLELPRLKLIMQRLWSSMDEESRQEVAPDYEKCIEIVDAFGFKEPVDFSLHRCATRVFTPTGKLLTEIATDWPEELQYGWMNRKVIGVFELMEALQRENGVSQVLIIFSDHVLFLDVFRSGHSLTPVQIADLLMNSLINEKPLPEIALLPALKVKFWCSIDEILCNGYCALDNDSFVSFMSYGTKKFNSKTPLEVSPVQNFKILDKNHRLAQKSIMTMVQKAKVLYKSTQFHLFNDEVNDLQTFYSAHEWAEFLNEQSVAPVVVLLNGNDKEIDETFKNHKNVFIVLTASFINHHTVQICGHTISKGLVIEEIVRFDDIRSSLRDILAKSFDALYRSIFLSEVCITGNLILLSRFLNSLDPSDSAEDVTFSTYPAQKPVKPLVEPLGETVNVPTKSEKPEKPPKPAPKKQIPKQTQKESQKPQTQEKRRSLFSGLIHKLTGKSKKKHPQKKSVPEKKKIPNTDIPKGKKQEYTHLYQPQPHLREASHSSTIEPSEPIASNRNANENASKNVTQNASRNVSVNTNTSSQYSDGSVEARHNFTFPMLTVEERNSEDDETVRRFSTERKSSASVVTPANDSNLGPQQEIIPPAETEQKVDSEITGKDNKKTDTDNAVPVPEPASGYENKEKTPKDAKNTQRVVNEVKLFKPDMERVQEEEDKKAITSQDIARALEHINAAGISPETYQKYKVYEELPISILQNDGEANWTALSRDNSSNLQDHVQAIKEETNMDSMDIVDFTSSAQARNQIWKADSPKKNCLVKSSSILSTINSSRMTPPAMQFDSSEGTFDDLECGMITQDLDTPKEAGTQHLRTSNEAGTQALRTPQESRKSQESGKSNWLPQAKTMVGTPKGFSEGNKGHFSGGNKEESYQSLNSQYVNQFGKIMDQEFSLEDEKEDDQKSLAFTVETLCEEPMKNPTESPNTSEEYVSSSEIVDGFNSQEQFFYENLDKVTLMRLSSSERTLMNVAREVNKENDRLDDGFTIKFDSVAYLSDILNGTVKI